MPAFSNSERRFSNLLKRFPGFRAQLKTGYQCLNYVVYGQRGFTHALLDGLQLETPSSITGLQEPDAHVAEFFGYYDISPWSLDGQYYVTQQVALSSREAAIVIYDLKQRTRSIAERTSTWTWQQGAMPTWLIHRGEMCLGFNTIQAGILGARIYSPARGPVAFLPFPIQSVNHHAGIVYSINYPRLAANKTEYGYPVNAQNLSAHLPLEADGIWATEINSGAYELIVSIQDLLQQRPRSELRRSMHEINHLSTCPNGRHLVFLHRFRGPDGQFSRLYVARHDGANLRMLLDDDMVSHYTWIDSSTLIAWARTQEKGDRYYRIHIETGDITPLPNCANTWGDGHPAFHTTSNLIVSDSYPDRARQQHLFLMNIHTFEPQEIGKFFQPIHFRGPRRVDLHPRWNHEGTQVSIDTGHTGIRRNYIINLSAITCNNGLHDSTSACVAAGCD